MFYFVLNEFSSKMFVYMRSINIWLLGAGLYGLRCVMGTFFDRNSDGVKVEITNADTLRTSLGPWTSNDGIGNSLVLPLTIGLW